MNKLSPTPAQWLLLVLLTVLFTGRAGAQPGTVTFGNLVQLNGSTDAVQASSPAFSGTDNFTLEAYVRPAALPTAGFETIIHNGFDNGTTGDGLALGIGGAGGAGGSKLMVLFCGLQFFDTGLTLPAANQWYHVAVTRRSGTTFAYLDGVQGPNTTTAAPNAPSTTFSVGSQNGIRFLNGQLDEARAWNVGRTQSQILSTANAPLTGNEAGLVAYWDMNRSGQGAGLTVVNKASATGNTLTGSTVGTASTPAFLSGTFGNAVTLDGSNDYLDLPANAAFQLSGNATVEAWVKPSSLGAEKPVFINCVNPDSWGILLATSSGGFGEAAVVIGGTQHTLAGTTPLTTGVWTHLAAVRDGTTLRLYVNGLPDGTLTIPGGALRSGLAQSRIGKAQNNSPNLFGGSIDEVRVWSLARTETEIAVKLNSQLAGTETGLVAYYDMNRSGQGAGLTVSNKATATGTALDGTTVGTASTPVFTLANNFGIDGSGAMRVTGLSPVRNANTAALAGNVALTFSQDVNGSTAAHVRVMSGQAGGRKAGTATVSNNVLTFDPSANFKPGEVLQVTVPATVQSQLGAAAVPHVHQFTTAAGAGPGLFSKFAVVNVGTTLGQAVQADVDNDGDLDLLVVDGTPHTVSVRLNNGNASYGGSTAVNVGTGSAAMVVADLDGDGDLDFATTNTTANTVSIRMNDGTGNFSGSTTLSGGFSAPNGIAAGDVDGDGDLDLLIANNAGTGSVSVRLNDGNGLTYTNAPTLTGLVFPIAPVLGDLDSDGDLDLVVCSNLSGAAVTSVFLNNGTGTFSNGGSIATGVANIDAALADFDNDGDLDVLTANIGSNTVSVQLNNGSGTFSSGPAVTVGNRPCAISAGDFDGDGDLDFVTANNVTPGSLSFRFNNGNAIFTGSANAASGNQPLSVATGDADGDGDLDVAMIEGAQTAIYLNQPAPTITSFAPVSGAPGTLITLTGNGFLGTTSISFNGTLTVPASVISGTSLTVLVPNGATSGLLTVTTGSGSGTSSSSFTVIVPSLTVTALNPNRNAPVAARSSNVAVTFDQPVAAATAGNLRVFSNLAGGRRTGTATVSGNVLSFDPTTDFRPGEVLRVSVPGSILGTAGGTAVPHVYQFSTTATPGPLTFSNSTTAVGTTPSGVAVGDLDGDGDLDFVTVNNTTTGTVSVRLNNGSGAFSNGATVTVGNSPRAVALADLDGDGDLDLLVANSGGTGSVSIRLNNGSASFSGSQNVAVGTGVLDLAVGDVDGDGDLDFITADFSANTLSVRLNSGSGVFGGSGSVSTGAGTGPFSVALADVDNDGDLDALSANNTTGTMSVCLNDGGGAFSGSTTLATGAGLRHFTLGDVDGNGFLDLVASNSTANTLTLNLNTGGTFGTATTLATPGNPRGTALTDIDGDGDLDLLSVSQTATNVSLQLNNGSGSFGAPAALASVGAGAQLVVPADLDGDGDLDFVVNNFTDNTVSVRLNQPAPVITSFAPASGSVGTYVVLTGTNFLNMTGVSFNGTPAPGFVLNSATSVTVRVPAGATTGTITLSTGSGTGTSATAFTVVPTLNVLSRTPARHALTAAASSNVSVTYDQVLDPTSLNAATSTPPPMRVFGSELQGRRSGALTASGSTLSFDPGQNFRPGERVTVSVPGGVVRGSGTAAGQVWRFTTAVAGGSGSFSGGGELALAAAAGTVHTVDIDGDGDLDVLTEDGTNSRILQLRNNGGGGFTAGPATAVNTGLQNFATGDIDADGDIDLVTANFSPNSASVRFNDGSGNFSTGGYNLVYNSSSPIQAQLLDTDADGDLDLVMLCNGTTSTRALIITPNDGAGNFAGGGFVLLGSNVPGALASADVDNDGDLDLLVSYTTNSGVIGGVLLYRNNGAASFDAGTNITNFITNIFHLEDVDADGDTDLVYLTTFGGGSTSLLVSLNDGAGSFAAPTFLSLGSTANPAGLTLADIDADGDLDALLANSGANTVSVCVNNGTGTFASPVAVPVGGFPLGITTGDVDNDGDVDLLTASAGDGTVSLRLNQTPTAAVITSFAPTSGPVGSTVTITGTNLAGTTGLSFNGTAATSFTVNSATSVTVVVPAGATTGLISLSTAANGTATTGALSPSAFTVLAPQMQVTARNPARHFNSAPLASNVALTFSQNVSAATAGNVRVHSAQAGGRKAGTTAVSTSTLTFNPTADFRPGEVLSVSVPATVLGSAGETNIPHVYQFRAAVGSGGGSFGTPATLAAGTRPLGLALAELNGDGNLDLITVNSNTAGSARVQMGNGSGAFGSAQTLSLGNNSGEIATGDVDSDGDLDAVIANNTSGTVSLLLNASGTFGVAQTVNVGGEPNGVALADVDGDGDLDLLTVKRLSHTVDIQQNDGNGIFTSLGTAATGSNTLPRNIAVGDVDNDGDLDLLTSNQNGSVSILLNNGAGTFGSLTSLSASSNSHLTLGDLDADGDLDLAVSMVGTGIGIFTNSGGIFTAASTLATNFNPRSVNLADLDGDGDLDALASNDDGLVSVHLNGGSGSFAPGLDVPVGQGSQRMALADLNNDGILDLVVSNFSDNTISIGLGQTAAPGPAISSFTPAHAVVGTGITISGSNLGGATAVSFNGTAASGFSVNGAGTQLTVNVPTGATTGLITITTGSGTATSSSSFELDLLLDTPTTIATGTYHDVTVTASTATLGGDATISGTLRVQDGATFADACNRVLGSGSFVLDAGATLQVCHAAGISASGSSGAVQLSGPRSFSDDASYVFNGSAPQATGDGLPSRVRNLSSTNPNELTLTASTSVAQVLRLADGNLSLNGQPLTLLSDASGSALAVNAGQGLVTGGTAVVQRYISPALNAGRGYRHFSSPVSGETVGGLATGASPVVVNPAYNSSATPGSVTPFPTLFAYDQSRVPATGNNVAEFDKGWLSPTALTDPMSVGQGYTMQALGNETILFNGTLNSGNLNQNNLSHGSGPQAGWHLLGNPYPAPLDWSTLTASNFTNMGSAVYVFQSSGQYTGSYRVYQAGLGDPIIASGQGFFVRSTGPGAALSLSNANRLTEYTPNGAQLFRSTPDLRPQLHLALRPPGLAEPDLSYIYFAPDATATFDQQGDAYKLRNPGRASLFSLLGTDELSINGLAPLTSLDVIVPLGLTVPAAGTYTLEAAQLLNFGSTIVYLRDALTGSVINLSQQPAYSFSVAAGSLSSTRFSVLFRPGTATATHTGLDAAQIELFPNPAQRSVTLIIPRVAAVKTVSVQLLNSLGQVVLSRKLPVSRAGLEARLDISGLAAGVYSLQVSAGTSALGTKRLIISTPAN